MTTVNAAAYDPFARGPFPVARRTIDAPDRTRGRVFPCDVWYPGRYRDDGPAGADVGGGPAAHPGRHPLVLYSHHSGGNRRAATFLCRHLAGHGYVVAAADHSEVVATDLGPQEHETGAERAARIERIVTSRVPDLRFLLDHLLGGHVVPGADLDATRIGLVGHSLGGWTVLAAPEVEPRVGAVVALAPGGSSRPMPGVLALTLAFGWGRDVPTLVLAAGR